jgi:hypothetical protein
MAQVDYVKEEKLPSVPESFDALRRASYNARQPQGPTEQRLP